MLGRYGGWILGVGAVLGILLFPFRSLNCPAWDVTFVASSGRALANMSVRIRWQNYSAEVTDHEAIAVTDSQGRVVFPRQFLRASLASRAVITLWSAMSQGVHASFGPSAWLVVSDEGIRWHAHPLFWHGENEAVVSRVVVEASHE